MVKGSLNANEISPIKNNETLIKSHSSLNNIKKLYLDLETLQSRYIYSFLLYSLKIYLKEIILNFNQT